METIKVANSQGQEGILQALEKVQPGMTVELEAGEYRLDQTLYLPSGIFFSGQDKTKLIFDTGILQSQQACLCLINIENTEVSNLQIEIIEKNPLHSNPPLEPDNIEEKKIEKQDIVVIDSAKNIHLKNIFIQPVDNFQELDCGVFITESITIVITNCEIQNCYEGLHAKNSKNINILNNRLHHNILNGIIYQSSEGLAENNECWENIKSGINAIANESIGPAKLHARNNRCHHNKSNGIVYESSEGLAENNECWENKGGGVVAIAFEIIGPAKLHARNNRCHHNKQYGIVYQSSEGMAENNECWENEKSGILAIADEIIGPAKLHALNNRCHHNKTNGINYQQSEGLAENNECWENEHDGILAIANESIGPSKLHALNNRCHHNKQNGIAYQSSEGLAENNECWKNENGGVAALVSLECKIPSKLHALNNRCHQNKYYGIAFQSSLGSIEKNNDLVSDPISVSIAQSSEIRVIGKNLDEILPFITKDDSSSYSLVSKTFYTIASEPTAPFVEIPNYKVPIPIKGSESLTSFLHSRGCMNCLENFWNARNPEKIEGSKPIEGKKFRPYSLVMEKENNSTEKVPPIVIKAGTTETQPNPFQLIHHFSKKIYKSKKHITNHKNEGSEWNDSAVFICSANPEVNLDAEEMLKKLGSHICNSEGKWEEASSILNDESDEVSEKIWYRRLLYSHFNFSEDENEGKLFEVFASETTSTKINRAFLLFMFFWLRPIVLSCFAVVFAMFYLCNQLYPTEVYQFSQQYSIYFQEFLTPKPGLWGFLFPYSFTITLIFIVLNSTIIAFNSFIQPTFWQLPSIPILQELFLKWLKITHIINWLKAQKLFSNEGNVYEWGWKKAIRKFLWDTWFPFLGRERIAVLVLDDIERLTQLDQEWLIQIQKLAKTEKRHLLIVFRVREVGFVPEILQGLKSQGKFDNVYVGPIEEMSSSLLDFDFSKFSKIHEPQKRLQKLLFGNLDSSGDASVNVLDPTWTMVDIPALLSLASSIKLPIHIKMARGHEPDKIYRNNPDSNSFYSVLNSWDPFFDVTNFNEKQERAMEFLADSHAVIMEKRLHNSAPKKFTRMVGKHSSRKEIFELLYSLRNCFIEREKFENHGQSLFLFYIMEALQMGQYYFIDKALRKLETDNGRKSISALLAFESAIKLYEDWKSCRNSIEWPNHKKEEKNVEELEKLLVDKWMPLIEKLLQTDHIAYNRISGLLFLLGENPAFSCPKLSEFINSVEKSTQLESKIQIPSKPEILTDRFLKEWRDGLFKFRRLSYNSQKDLSKILFRQEWATLPDSFRKNFNTGLKISWPFYFDMLIKTIRTGDWKAHFPFLVTRPFWFSVGISLIMERNWPNEECLEKWGRILILLRDYKRIDFQIMTENTFKQEILTKDELIKFEKLIKAEQEKLDNSKNSENPENPKSSESSESSEKYKTPLMRQILKYLSEAEPKNLSDPISTKNEQDLDETQILKNLFLNNESFAAWSIDLNEALIEYWSLENKIKNFEEIPQGVTYGRLKSEAGWELAKLSY